MEEGSERCQWLPLKLEEGKHKPTNEAVFNLCNHLCIKYTVINSRESDKKFFISVGGGDTLIEKTKGKNKQKSPKKDRVNKLVKKNTCPFSVLKCIQTEMGIKPGLGKDPLFFLIIVIVWVKAQGSGILIQPWWD